MKHQRIERFQTPIVWTGMLAIMLGLGAKQILVTGRMGDYIALSYFLLNSNSAPIFVWVYWLLIFIFIFCFCIGALLEWLKRRG